MTKPKHTPGPWKIDEAEDLPLAVIEDTEDGMGICEIGERTQQNLTNARLIAATPDFLEALELIEVETIDKSIKKIAENAIRKAGFR